MPWLTSRAGVHIPTVLSIGVVSFVAVTVIHEAGGHGVACLLVGGEARAVSTTELRCDGPEDGARLVVSAAGSIATIVAGLAVLAAGIARGPVRGLGGYVLWLFGATSLFHAGAYMLIGPLVSFGDWAYVARHLDPVPFWIAAIAVLGFLVNVLGSRLAARSEWQPLLGDAPDTRRTRMRLLTALPLAAALVVSLAAGLLSPLEPRYSLVTSALAPLVLLLLVGLPAWPNSDPPAPAVQLSASVAWIAAGLLVGVGFVVLLGPGLGSFAGYPIAR